MNRIDREEERIRIFTRDGWICQTCGESVYKYGTPQLAHLIADTKPNRKKYGTAVINHPLNRKGTCCLNCNDAQNIGGNPEECRKLIDKIIEMER